MNRLNFIDIKYLVFGFGLIFTLYLVVEINPYADSNVRGRLLVLTGTHNKYDFTRHILEGIIFLFKYIYDEYDAGIDMVVAIGDGSKNSLWLQIQADIFNKKVISLKNEQVQGMGADILAAVGLG